MFIYTFVVYKKQQYTDINCESVCHTLYGSGSGGAKASYANDGEVYLVVVVCFIPSRLGAPTFLTAIVMPRTCCTGCITWIRCSDWQLNCQPESLGAVPPHTVCTDSESSGLRQWVDPVWGDPAYYTPLCVHLHMLMQEL